MQDITPNSARRDVRRGFTLVEVMVSIALVLIIILGVNQVFALTSRAIGAGNAMSEQVRDARNAQTIFTQDLSNAEVDRAPFLYLQSEVFVGFRNRADQLADLDFSPADTNRANVDRAIRTLDRNGNGREDDAGDLTPRAFMTSRTHRADVLKFFSRQTGRRQTGNINTFVSGVSGSEQYITYGHLRQPAVLNDLTTGRLPGIGPSGNVLGPSLASPNNNPNNFYATQWVLGRVSFLMREPETVGSTKVIRDTTVSGSPAQTYYGRGAGQTPNSSMAPFSESSRSTNDGVGNNASELIQYSFYDVMGMGMERYRNDILPIYINGNPDGSGTKRPTWYANTIAFRHTGFPTPSRPLTSQGVARTVPCFVNACTQFAVEYAGDFVSQNETGAIIPSATANQGDGIIDFNVVGNRRIIRWYGFPRDVNNDGQIRMTTDVVPLRDYVPQPMGFERTILTRATDYGQDAAVPANSQYLCVWGPDTASLPRPRMIRIVMAIDDPAARLAREQFFEYVVELP